MKRAIVTVGLQFGDESKGGAVDKICAEKSVDVVVKYSGGANCVHSVVTEDGRRHTFSQWGAGTLRGVKTYLGLNFVVDPMALGNEAKHLKEMGVHDPWSLICFNPSCLITTPYHIWMNRIRETVRGETRHGSCGQGIGETRSYWLTYGQDAIRISDIESGYRLNEKLELLRQRLLSEIYELVADNYFDSPYYDQLNLFLAVDPGTIARDLYKAIEPLHSHSGLHYAQWEDMKWDLAVFEGSQGLLLDEHYGFPPHNTWSTVTSRHADEMLAEVDCTNIITIGCIRAFTTRHGAGPLPTFDSILSSRMKDDGNPVNDWQGELRWGYFDFPLYGYAIKMQSVDALSVSWLDCFGHYGSLMQNVAESYKDFSFDLFLKENPTPCRWRQKTMASRLADSCKSNLFIMSRDEFLKVLGCPIAIKGYGPKASDRIMEL